MRKAPERSGAFLFLGSDGEVEAAISLAHFTLGVGGRVNEKGVVIMTDITLDIQSARLRSTFGTGYGVASDGKWSLTFEVKLAGHDRLELGTGEKSDEIAMHLTFRETKPQLVDRATERTKDVTDAFSHEGDIVCGTVSYHPERNSKHGLDGHPASILFDIYTPPDVMASMLCFAENGRFVKSVTVDVRGMEYGWAPDGSMKKWADNADNKFLPIVNVDYLLPLLEEPEPDYDDDETKAKRAPKTAVGADLVPLMREMLKFQKWALYALAIIASAVVFSKWR